MKVSRLLQKLHYTLRIARACRRVLQGKAPDFELNQKLKGEYRKGRCQGLTAAAEAISIFLQEHDGRSVLRQDLRDLHMSIIRCREAHDHPKYEYLIYPDGVSARKPWVGWSDR